MNQPDKYAKLTILQFTLREMRALVMHKMALIWLGAIICLLVITGPFGTLDRLNLFERVTYWAMIAPLTFVLAASIDIYIGEYSARKSIHKWTQYITSISITCLLLSVIVWGITISVEPDKTLSFSPIFLKVSAVTIPITALLKLTLQNLNNNSKSDQTTHIGENAVQTFYKRLPAEIGKDIISLNAQDHYIKVTTTKGSEMILMRMSDAVQELNGFDGFQTHRSWWVMKKHIKSIERNAGKTNIICQTVKWFLLAAASKPPLISSSQNKH